MRTSRKSSDATRASDRQKAGLSGRAPSWNHKHKPCTVGSVHESRERPPRHACMPQESQRTCHDFLNVHNVLVVEVAQQVDFTPRGQRKQSRPCASAIDENGGEAHDRADASQHSDAKIVSVRSRLAQCHDRVAIGPPPALPSPKTYPLRLHSERLQSHRLTRRPVPSGPHLTGDALAHHFHRFKR